MISTEIRPMNSCAKVKVIAVIIYKILCIVLNEPKSAYDMLLYKAFTASEKNRVLMMTDNISNAAEMPQSLKSRQLLCLKRLIDSLNKKDILVLKLAF